LICAETNGDNDVHGSNRNLVRAQVNRQPTDGLVGLETARRVAYLDTFDTQTEPDLGSFVLKKSFLNPTFFL
jgi:hypothetical protein